MRHGQVAITVAGAGEAGRVPRARVGGRYDGPHGPGARRRGARARRSTAGPPRRPGGRSPTRWACAPARCPLRTGATSRDKLFAVDRPADLPTPALAGCAARRRGPAGGTVTESGSTSRCCIGAAVLLVAVGAVRLLHPRSACPVCWSTWCSAWLIGESGLGIQFEDADLTRTLGFCALDRDHRRGWPDRPLDARCGRCSGCRRRWPRSAWWSASRSSASSCTCCSACDWQLALLYGAVLSLDRRGRGLLHPAPAAAAARGWSATLEAESGINDAPGRCCWSCCCRRRPRRALGRGGSEAAARRLRAGRRRGDRLRWSGWPGAWALRRAALPSAGPLSARRGRADRARVRRRRGRARVRASSPSTWPAWCSATPGCRTGRRSSASPTGWPGWPRSACSSCSACSPRRPGWPARCCRRWSSACVLVLLARPLSVVVCARRRSGSAGASRRSCPGPGCAARCRSCWPRSRSRRGVPGATRLFDVVFVLVVVFTLVQAGTLAPVARLAGGDRAGRGRPSCGWRPRRWSGCGADLLAAGGPGGVAAGRRAHRRAAAAGRRVGDAGAARRRRLRARRRTPGSRPATAC